MSSCRSAGACAKDRRWPSSSVRQRVASIKRGDPSPRIEEELGRISVKIVTNRFTLSRTISQKALPYLLLRPFVTRTVPHLEDRHIHDRRKFAEEMLARLALASGRRISRKIATSRRLDLAVICFSDEKIFRVDAAAPGRSFHTFYRGKQGRRNNATSPFSGYTMRNGEVALSRRPTF